MDLLNDSFAPPSRDSLPAAAILAALIAAGVGAVAWAAVAWLSGYEVGYVAWAIGGLVGFAVVKTGGRGVACAGVAAAMTVLGIFGGKVLGTHLAVQAEFDEVCEQSFSREIFAEMQFDAVDFAALSENASDTELQRFIHGHGYTMAGSPEDVTGQEVQMFQQYNAPILRSLAASTPAYEDWFQERLAENREAFDAEFSLVSAITEDLGGIDVIFAVLAVSTAFGMIRRAGVQVAATSDAEVPPFEAEERRAA